MNGQLRKEFDYFLSHHADMVRNYRGRVVVVKDEKVLGDYATELEALTAAQAKLAPGTFLIQRVKETPDSYTQTFHSRVAFG